MESSDKEMSLPDAAYLYLTEHRYPEPCSDDRKRAIRKKARMFTIKQGVLFYKKKKKEGVSSYFTISKRF